jgi:O-antigen/teichoic acid export membrane protein
MSHNNLISISAKLKEVGRHSVIYGLGSVAQSAAGLILLPTLTGALSKEDFGVYSLILMAGGIASTVFYLGMASALPRSYFDYESEEDRRAVFTTAFVIMLIGALFQILLGYFLAENISILLIGKPGYANAVSLALLGSALGFINTYFFSYLRLLRKSIASVVFSLISFAGSIGLTLYLLEKSPGDLNVPFEAMVYTQAIIALVFLARYVKSAFIFRLKVKEVSNLVHFGVASIIASFGGVLIESLDRIMIQHYMTLSDVGIYSAALRVSMLINVVLIGPFTQVWSPMMLEYRSKANIADLLSRVFSVFMILGGLVVITAALFARDLLPLLIRSGVDSLVISVFLISIFGLLIYGATNFVGAGLFYERKVYLISFAYYGVFFIKVLLGLILIPLLGLIGAALSAIFAYALVPTAIYAIAKKYFSFQIEWGRLGIFLAIASPALTYGFFDDYFPHLGVGIRIVWLLLTFTLIYFKCLTDLERVKIAKFWHG